jgi:long-chain fatty acid transport protein
MITRIIRLSGWMLAVLLVADLAIAGGIINKNNQSAEYMRTLSRHAATDYADIAVYNPAGTAKMKDGLYTKLDLMYFGKDYYNDVPGYGELSQDDPSLVPAFFTIYKKKKWAGFFAFTVPAGGGELNYENGDARTVQLATGVAGAANAALAANNIPDTFYYNQIDAGSLEVKQSSVYGFTFGGSYAINDAWSLAVGARYSTGTREFDGSATISASNPLDLGGGQINAPLTPSLNLEEDASGWAGILGVNFAPNEKLNTALTFISNTKMDYEMDVKQDTTLPDGSSLAAAIGYPDGSNRRIDIPAQLGFGISYRFTPPFKVDFNYTYYLEKDAEIDTYEDEGNSWDLAISGEYTFTPRWKASLGYALTNIALDADEQINEPEEPKLDANSFAGGVVWSATADLDVTLAAAYIMYEDVTDSMGIEYGKTVTNVSLGVQYRFF